MPDPLLFSIIIPAFNRGYMISASIESILNQTYPHFELIIIDDGSTDNTKAVVDSFPDPRIIYFYKKNEERGVARNTGMDIAKGDYITFLDSDDNFYPNHLEHAFTKLTTLGFPDFYRQAYEVKDESGKVLYANDKLKGDANRVILTGNYFSCIGVFLRKDVTREVKFNTSRYLCPSEDWDYWLRLSVRCKFHYDNTVTSCMLQHNERSLCNFNERGTRLAIAMLVKSLKRDPVFMAARADSIDMIRAQMYSLLCLNKVLHKSYKGLQKDIIKTIKLSKKELFKRRTLAIVKHHLLNLIN